MTKKVKVKKIYCIICGKYVKFKNTKITYIFEKALVLSTTCSKSDNKDEKHLKKKAFEKSISIEILKFLLKI